MFKHQTYNHINTLYKRYTEGALKNCIILGDFSDPETEYLKDLKWLCYEKIDGTNTSVYFDGTTMEIHGKSESAQIPQHLVAKIQSLLNVGLLRKVFPQKLGEDGKPLPMMVKIYGEGYGTKIQKAGPRYIKDDCDFRIFDINIDGWWLEMSAVEEITEALGLGMVPFVGVMSITEAESLVKAGFKSKLQCSDPDLKAEGLVCRPILPLRKKDGSRVMVKIKSKDYEDLARKQQ